MIAGTLPVWTVGYVLVLYTSIYLAASALFRRVSGHPSEWFVGETSTVAFILLAAIVLAVVALANMALISSVLFALRPELNRVPVPGFLTYWGRETAGLFAIGPFVVVHLGPLLRKWLNGGADVPRRS